MRFTCFECSGRFHSSFAEVRSVPRICRNCSLFDFENGQIVILWYSTVWNFCAVHDDSCAAVPIQQDAWTSHTRVRKNDQPEASKFIEVDWIRCRPANMEETEAQQKYWRVYPGIMEEWKGSEKGGGREHDCVHVCSVSSLLSFAWATTNRAI